MKKNNLLVAVIVLLVIITSCSKPEKKSTLKAIGFYNVENLFDTINNPEINDGKYTPESDFNWDSEKYNHKLNQLARVISSMDTINGFPSVIGLSEVENKGVVEDLINNDQLKEANYSIIHKDSPDGRGIDVAMIYRSEDFRPVETNFLKVNLPDSGNATREILYCKGVLADADTLHLFFNHWVSRWGGQEKTEPFRIYIAKMLKHLSDSIQNVNQDAKILMAGDLNDNPTDTSVFHVLKALEVSKQIKSNSLYNLALTKFKNGEGSLYYHSWDMFDQVIVSPSMLKSNQTVSLKEDSQRIIKYDWMLYEAKDGTKRPNRTAARSYYGGFSDHLPVMVYIKVTE